MNYRHGCVECAYHKIRNLFGEPERVGANWSVDVWYIGTFNGVDHFLSDDEFMDRLDCDVPIFSVIWRTWDNDDGNEDDIGSLYQGDITSALEVAESLRVKHMTKENEQ